MTKREMLLNAIKAAGYHGDTRRATQLLADNPVSHMAYNIAWQAGEAAKRAGQPCSCYQCQKGE